MSFEDQLYVDRRLRDSGLGSLARSIIRALKFVATSVKC